MHNQIEVQLPEGWRAVAYRPPAIGEYYLGMNGQPLRNSYGTYYSRLVVEREWHWPTWLKAGWITMDSDGDWFAWNAKPCFCSGMDSERHYWWANGEQNIVLDPDFFDFSPPPCKPEDARASLRANPAYRLNKEQETLINEH